MPRPMDVSIDEADGIKIAGEADLEVEHLSELDLADASSLEVQLEERRIDRFRRQSADVVRGSRQRDERHMGLLERILRRLVPAPFLFIEKRHAVELHALRLMHGRDEYPSRFGRLVVGERVGPVEPCAK